MFLFSLMALALADPVLEVPVDGPRDAARTVRSLGELGYSATIVKVATDLRVRLDLSPPDRGEASLVADEVADALGRGVLTFDDVATPPPRAVATSAPMGLASRLDTEARVLFRFRRVMSNGVVSHTWIRDRQRVAINLHVEEGDLVGSRLLLLGEEAWVWTDQGRTAASAERVRSWAAELAPDALLIAAFTHGFGGTIPPVVGCEVLDGVSYCVGESPEIVTDAIVFRDLLRTADGEWLPATIEWFSAGERQDRVQVLELSFPGDLETGWFDAGNPGIELSP